MKIKIQRYDWTKTVFRLIISFTLIIGIELLTFYFFEKEYNAEENLITIYGNVTEISFDEDDEQFLFKIDSSEKIYTGSMQREEIINLSKILKENNSVELVVSKRLDNEEVRIIKAKVNGEYIIDLTEYNINTYRTFLIISIILLTICVVTIILNIIIAKKKYYKEVDYLEFYLPFQATSYINKKSINIDELEKRKIKIVFGYIGFVVILMIGIYIFGSRFPDYPHIIIPIVVVLMASGTYLLFRLTVIYKSTDENIKEFVTLYKKYLNNEIKYKECEPNKHLTKEGYVFFKYYDDDYDFISTNNYDERLSDEVIPYNELDLYVVCVFKNNFHYVNIFICSDNKEFSNPYYFELNPMNYAQIKEYHIEVNNLDYLLENLEQEIIKNKTKFKSKVISYKNKN